uniref:E4 protein n=1 Tax=Human papillomavirus TaxID=10566 RepID=A0A385PJ72_9PAPI|nr:MAG: E4 protein [Human papillomavirus]
MKLLSPLSPALQGLPLPLPGRTPTPPFPTAPKSPYPTRKAPEESRGRRSGPVPGRKHLQFDEDDENKENLPPKEPPQQKEEDLEEGEEEQQRSDLSRLLRKLALDIDLYQEQVYRDLLDLKQKLGIHQS